MRQSLIYCTLALLFVGGAFVGQVSANEAAQAAPAAVAQSTPAVAAQAAPAQAQVPAQMGYSRASIRSMPLLSRPNRPGHFIGNTIRRRNSR